MMKRIIHFDLSDQRLSMSSLVELLHHDQVGAVVCFDGLVRNHNEGHYVIGLEYQAYPQLAQRVGREILQQECERHRVLGAAAIHRTGELAIGDSAVALAVVAEHRGVAFAAAMAILERLKHELPIWKKETYADGSIEWVGPDQTHALTGQIDPALPVWKANLEQIWISSGNDFRGRHGCERGHHAVQSVDAIECIAGMGLRGDRYFGYQPDFKGQVTFFEANMLSQLRQRFALPELNAGQLRRNLIVSGVRLCDWIGRRFMFQGLEFEGTEECKPCYWMDQAIAPGAEAFLQNDCRGGLRARIISGGVIRCG